jgi:hypothetical protein
MWGVGVRFRGRSLGRLAVALDQMPGAGEIVGDLRQSFVGRSLPGQCPAVTLRPIASPTARNRFIESNPDGSSGAQGKTAHSSPADPTSWFQLLTMASA